MKCANIGGWLHMGCARENVADILIEALCTWAVQGSDARENVADILIYALLHMGCARL